MIHPRSADAAADLRRVCLHEYAHLAVARAFGASGFVRIRRVANDVRAPPRFAGAFQMHGDLDERAWHVVALAGTIAEWLADAPSLDEAAILARLGEEADALSPVDACLAAGWDATDVRECIRRLRSAWLELMRDADERAATIEAGADG